MKHVIITTSDARFEDFVYNHWLKSLQANVNLSNIDVAIFDYGLSEEQVEELKKKGVIVYKCVKDNLVNNIRFRDAASFLKEKEYDQVMITDGGDLIFQTDISPLFEENKDQKRAACEDIQHVFEDLFMKDAFFEEDEKKIKKMLEGTQMVNVGVVLGPAKKFASLSEETIKMIKGMDKFGPDQLAINYILYRDGFVKLDRKYNFVITTSSREFRIEKGVFYFKDGEKIPIVHNAGRYDYSRPVENFGFGEDRNKLKKGVFYGMRALLAMMSFFKRKKTSV